MRTNVVLGRKVRKKGTIMLQLNIRSGCKQQINIEFLNLGNKFFLVESSISKHSAERFCLQLGKEHVCLHRNTYTRLLTNFFSLTHLQYKKGLIYMLIDVIFWLNETTLGVEQDFRNLSNALQCNIYLSYLNDKIITI